MTTAIKLLIGMMLPLYILGAAYAVSVSGEEPGGYLLFGLAVFALVFGPLTHRLHPGKESPKTRIQKRYKTTSIIFAGVTVTPTLWALYIGISEGNQEGYVGAVLGLSYLVILYYLYRYCAFRSTKKQLKPAFLNSLLKLFQAAPSFWLLAISFGWYILVMRALS